MRLPYSSFVLTKSVKKLKTLLLQHVPCLHVFLSISSFSTSPCFLGCNGWNSCIPSRSVYCDLNLIDIFKRWWFWRSEKVTLALSMNRIGPLIKGGFGKLPGLSGHRTVHHLGSKARTIAGQWACHHLELRLSNIQHFRDIFFQLFVSYLICGVIPGIY